MKKINYLKILLPLIFVSFFLININVSFFGDDYHFLGFNTNNFSAYIDNLITHYTLDNGRLIVHLLDSIFLKLPLIFWVILNSLMLTLICYFSSKIITENNKEKMVTVTTIIFFFISMLDISITNQSVYWISGSFNYVYPITLLFAYWYLLTKLDTNKKSFIFAIIIGFLASSSVEQGGMMTFGLTLLILFSRFKGFKNIKVFFSNNKKLITLLFITLIGILSVVLAPSQFIRLNTETGISFTETLVSNVKFIISNFTASVNILPYALLFNLFTILYVLSLENKKEKITFTFLSTINILISLYCIFTNKGVFSLAFAIAIIFNLAIYLITIIYLNIKLYKKIFSPLIISSILLIGSQFMMVISPTIGYRNLLFGLICFAFIIGLIFVNIPNSRKYSPFLVSILIIFALLNNMKNTIGYYQTRIIDKKNIEIINNIQNRDEDITLYKFPDGSNYCWSMPYISPFHEDCFKKYYKISGNINWK